MTAKAYLSQAKIISDRLKSMARQALSLQEALTNVSPKISDMPRPATPDIRKMEKLIVAKVDLDNRIAADADMLAEIAGAINSLPNPIHGTVLSNRYFADMTWREIAAEMHICERQLYRLHTDALAEIEKMSPVCSK
jgi:DNA-directed RNA polymerase specialized sigma subunit